MKEYLTIDGEYSNTTVIERSKFICYLKGIQDEEEARSFIEKIRKQNSLATHNCYAYIADEKGLVQKFSDDGEPQGTAGMPMLNALRGNKLFKTVAVVTRYFGGIKLGTGGLTRAYGGSVVECLQKAEIADMQEAVLLNIEPDYEGYSRLIKFLSDTNLAVIETQFDNVVKVKIAVKKDYYEAFKNKIVDAFNGRLTIKTIGCDFFAFR